MTKLHALGLEATEDDVLLSTHDLLAWLQKNGITETWLVGTEGMRSMLEAIGVNTQSTPQYVVLGYDTELTYDKIARASIHMHAVSPRGQPSRHGLPEPRWWTARCWRLPGNVQSDDGVDPEHITGKPNAGMICTRSKPWALSPSDAPWWATGSTPTWQWRPVPGWWACWCCPAKPLRPTLTNYQRGRTAPDHHRQQRGRTSSVKA